ncbi:rhomboid family intramembrane serine protease [Sphingobium phenoxybenzoativorans]|uniref:rhomboid family intramembrane serine protease n=1 Tax=Sphingobium phenoxybenzoativorans TaxID=1592790 RepID=UPI000871C864|nr:rhomboid family intramembrane serine protease [Sphingobium phenoxybenzoativorans]
MKIPRGRATDWVAGITTLAFLIIFLTGYTDSAALMAGFIPLRATDPAAFAQIAESAGMLPVWLTPLSAMFVHAGWMHIAFNMLMLMFCGRHVEHVMGAKLLLGLYAIGAYAAAAAQWLWEPQAYNPMIGASGGISALLGTYALLYSQQNVRAFGPVSANVMRILWLAAGWAAIQLMIGVAMRGAAGDLGHIAVAAHIGGFMAGLVLTKPALRLRFRKRPASV